MHANWNRTGHREFAGAVVPRSPQAPQEPLLTWPRQRYRQDSRPAKIDLTVASYRDEAGIEPTPHAVQLAGARLLEHSRGASAKRLRDEDAFVEYLKTLIFGTPYAPRTVGLRTRGATGALRLAAEWIAATRPRCRVWLGSPHRPLHATVLRNTGLHLQSYPYFDSMHQTLCFDAMLQAFRKAKPGDVMLLQGHCHNPTGASLVPAQWHSLAEVVMQRALLPLIVMDYHGLGEGLEADAAGLRLMLEAAGEGLLIYSCSNNFGSHCRRTAALFALTEHPLAKCSHLNPLARAEESALEDHGAAIVSAILQCPDMMALWQKELRAVRHRIEDVRLQLALGNSLLAPLRHHHGLFSMLPLDAAQIHAMRAEHAVYITDSGRINLAGLNTDTVPRFLSAFSAVRGMCY